MGTRLKHKVIVVAGPTASGKTSTGIKITEAINGEILNADSRQVYRYMDIGTNKGDLRNTGHEITVSDLRLKSFYIANSKVKGWLFNIADPDESFTVAQYQTLAQELIANLSEMQIVPVLVGGTGLYIDSLLKGYNLLKVVPDMALRRKLGNSTVANLQKMVKEEDERAFEALNQSDRKNPVRLIRRIEKLKAAPLKSASESEVVIDSFFVYPKYNRATLYEKIDERVEQMFSQGFIEEVKQLIKAGYGESKPMKGVGYKEVVAHLKGDLDVNETKEKIRQGHRNYAARQITWFEGKGRRYNLHRYDFEQDIDEIINAVKAFLAPS